MTSSPASASFCFSTGAAFSQFADRLGEGVVQHPDIARIADEVETLAVEFDALLDGRHEAPKRLAVLVGRGADAGDRVGEGLRAEVARYAERNREIEMADPQAVDSRQSRDGVGILDALRRLDLAEERAAFLAAVNLSLTVPGR